MADEILGISGHFDLSDIQKSINELIDGLDKIGLKTDVLSKRMNDAMNDIARSTDDAATKNKRALDVMSQGIAEAKNALANYPEQLRRAMNEADATALATAKLEAELKKLNTQFLASNVGSAEYSRLKQSIASVEQQVISNNHAHQAQLATIQEMEAGYSTLVQMYGLGTAATSANAVAHGAVTFATSAEAKAHTDNAKAVEEENKETEKNVEQKKKLTAAQKEAYAALSEYKVMAGLLTDSLNTDKSVEKYQEVKNKINEIIDKVRELYEEQSKKTTTPDYEKSTAEQIKSWEEFLGGADWTEATQKAIVYEGYLHELRDLLAQLKREYASVGETVKNTTDSSTSKQVDAYQTIQERIEILQTRLEQLQEIREKALQINESDWKIPSAIAESGANVGLWGEEKSEAIRRVAADIEEVKKELGEAQQKAEDFANAASNTTTLAESLGYDKMSISELLAEQKRIEEEVKKWDAELEKLRENNAFNEQGEKVKKLKGDINAAREAQKALNEELEGRPGYQRFFNGLREGFKGLQASIKNTFSDLKGAFTGGEKGFGGLFSLLTSGKFLGWTAAIGAIGGSIKGLSDSAEKLKLALDPLRAYVNDDVLGKLRQSFIDTAMMGSAQSTDDMAKAALQWIKYYNSIKDVPEAVQAVVDASRDLATISGTSAEKAAQTLTKLGGQFHLTAEEARNSVNILVNASKDSVVNINELMSALTSSGARVNQNGASLREYAAAISLTSLQYGSASQAASAYQRILQRLSTEANDNFNPKVVGVTKAFQNLHKEMEKGTDLSKKFGKMVWSQAQYFIKNADAIADYAKELDDATGKQNALSRAEETAEHHKKELANATDALAQAINLNLTPAFTKLLEGLVVVIQKLGTLTTKTKNFFKNVGEGINNNSWLKGLLTINGVLMSGPVGAPLATTMMSNSSNEWTKKRVQKEIKKRLDANKGIMGKNGKTTVTELLDEYDKSNPTGLSRDEVYEIAQKETLKWVKAYNANNAATTKGEGNEPGADNSVDDTKGQNALEKRLKTEEDLAKRRRKFQQQEAQQRISAMRAEEEAVIAEMKDGSAKEMRQLEFDHQKQLDELERQRQQMLEKNIEYAATEYDKNRGKGQAGFYAQGLDKKVGLTADQKTEIDARQRVIDAAYSKSLKDQMDKQRQYMFDFLKEYGSFEEQKLAITQEYEQKIQDEQDPYKRASLMIQRDEELQRINTEQLRQNINWDAIFNDVMDYDLEFLKKLQSQLEEAIKQGIENGIDAADLKVFADKLQEVKEAIVSKSGGIFSSNGIMGGSWMGEINQIVQKQNQLELRAQSKRAEANMLESRWKNAESDRGYWENESQVTIAKFGENSKEAQEALSKFKAASDKATKAQTAFTQASGEATAAEGAAAEGGNAMGLAITDAIIHGVNDNLQSASKMVTEWGLGDEDFQKKFAKFAESSQYATNAFDSLKNGDIAGVVYNLGEAFSSLGESFGLWSNSNREEIQRANEKLATATVVNTEAINRLTAAMEKQNPQDAYQSYIEALNAMKANEKNAQETMLNNAAMYDHDDTLRYAFNEKYENRVLLNEIFKKLGLATKNIETIGTLSGLKATGGLSLQDLLNLDAQTLNKLYEDKEGTALLTQLGNAIRDAENGGNYSGLFEDFLNYINAYSKDAYDSLQDQFLQNVTNIGFDSMYDNFVDMLMDMDRKAEDFSQDFEGYLRKAIYESMSATNVKPLLEGWYKAFAYAMQSEEANGRYLSPVEIKELMETGGTYKDELGNEISFQSYKAIQDVGLEIRDAIEELGLYNGTDNANADQQATYNSLEKWTYDQADEIISRATAIQIIGEHIYEGQAEMVEASLLMAQRIEGISGSMATITEGIDTAVELHRQCVDKLDSIVKNTTPIPEIRDIVKKISNNL